MNGIDGRELFGKKVRDKNSGFVGVIRGWAVYEHEQETFYVVKELKEGSKSEFESLWLAKTRMEIIE